MELVIDACGFVETNGAGGLSANTWGRGAVASFTGAGEILITLDRACDVTQSIVTLGPFGPVGTQANGLTVQRMTDTTFSVHMFRSDKGHVLEGSFSYKLERKVGT